MGWQLLLEILKLNGTRTLIRANISNFLWKNLADIPFMEVGHFGPLWSQFGNLAISKKFTGFRWKHQQIFPVFLVNSRNLSSFHRDKKTRLPDSLNALLKRTTKTILRKKAIIHCWLLNGTWDALCNKLLSVRRQFQLSSLSSCRFKLLL